MMNKRAVGTGKEDEAARFLQECGLKIRELNFRNRFGEIDIIASDGEYIVFVEVKYRNGESFGNPLDSVGYNKQKTICKVSEVYIRVNGDDFDAPIRYDVIAVQSCEDGMVKVKWLKNAVEYVL